MKKLISILLLSTLLTACAQDSGELTQAAVHTQFDLVIVGGRVIDVETRFDGIANVGIKNGRISAISTQSPTGDKTIDAEGLVVTAGFIDTEQHGLSAMGIKMNLRDGVTTQMDFEVGALNIEQWYAARQGKTQANYGTTVGQEFARMRIHDNMPLQGPDVSMPEFLRYRAESKLDGIEGWSVTRSSHQQVNQISQILDEGLRLGALGVGSTVGYARQGITTFELSEAQRMAANYGRLTAVHHRFHPSASTPTETAIGADEIIANAVALNAPLQIHHNNDYGWWEVEEKLKALRQQGFNIWATWYPWVAGSGPIAASVIAPDNWEKSMGFKYDETIFDSQLDRFLTKQEYLDLAEKEPGRVIIAYSPPRQRWIKHWLAIEHFVIAGDGMPTLDKDGQPLNWYDDFHDYVGHPRTAGTHAKVLRMAREQGIDLMQTLGQLSYWTAKHLGDTGLKAMQERGRMQEGMVADIVIFDPDTVQENADYAAGKNGLPSNGIPYVLINGTVVVEQSKVLENVFPGQSIRFPVEAVGRFTASDEPLTIQSLLPKDS
ncbi:aminoacylase [Thalassotalea sp. HSM 43]|uniref:amidohydrolase family protein n=1 Tax=Thalassotalea sp. HSM 43 TaxID=2552945 RepID=UPI001080B04D|nr:amidohydrolase family protein [Thalassotalea sp. HSM 43]QBY03297.1 aminoacylase [Thalassotalea sp. HSM 43]